jgi:subtilisin family serine protease
VFGLTVRSQHEATVNASLQVVFTNLRTGSTFITGGHTDPQGYAAVGYDPREWWPSAAILTPRSGQWSWWQSYPAASSVVQPAELPRAGRLGWWHQLLGITSYNEQRGKGIRIGVADTGAGPHPYLAHVKSAGAFLDGAHDLSANAANDVSEHGTHIGGLIGARPPASSSDYGGIAPGVEILCARVYRDENATASSGDIAAAIDALADGECDLINLSLGGTERSEIEQDAITAAIEAGVLLIAASGDSAMRRNFGG